MKKAETVGFKTYRKIYYYLDFPCFVQTVKYKVVKMQQVLSDGLKKVAPFPFTLGYHGTHF